MNMFNSYNYADFILYGDGYVGIPHRRHYVESGDEQAIGQEGDGDLHPVPACGGG